MLFIPNDVKKNVKNAIFCPDSQKNKIKNLYVSQNGTNDKQKTKTNPHTAPSKFLQYNAKVVNYEKIVYNGMALIQLHQNKCIMLPDVKCHKPKKAVPDL